MLWHFFLSKVAQLDSLDATNWTLKQELCNFKAFLLKSEIIKT